MSSSHTHGARLNRWSRGIYFRRSAALAAALLLALTLAGTAAAQSATVMTDQADYAPGTIVTITGSGWQPGETVTLSFVESPLIDTHPDLTAIADANGNIFNNQFSPDSHDISITFTLTATGNLSGLQAQTSFTDASPTLTITISGTGSVTAVRSSGTETIVSCNGGTCTFSNTPGTPQATCTSGTCIVQWNANYDATLTATAGGGFTFVGWSGIGNPNGGIVGCTGTSTCSASANGSQDFAVTATFETAPTVTAVSPHQGPTTGGTSVTITGTNFIGATTVKFGSTNATSFTVNSATQITATSSASAVGTVHITVTTPAGTTATSTNDQFTYTSPVVRRGQTIVAFLSPKDWYTVMALQKWTKDEAL